jgi:hypothetical protein
LKLLSLFDGEGGFPLAAVMNGIEPVAASEIEPYPIAITRSRFPNMKHLGDIAFVNGADIDPVDIATFGSPCFPAGTLVLTERGYREIEQLSVGERVLTHTGRWMPITDIGFKFDKTIVLHGNHMGLECTKNHPIYSANRVKVYPRKEDGKRTNAFKLTDKFDWIPAEDMVGKLWGVPRSFESIDIPINSASSLREKEMPELNVDTFYLIGRWIGDGWVRDGQRSNRPEGQHSGTIIICAGKSVRIRCGQRLSAFSISTTLSNVVQQISTSSPQDCFPSGSLTILANMRTESSFRHGRSECVPNYAKRYCVVFWSQTDTNTRKVTTKLHR